MIDATDKKDDFELYADRLSKVNSPIVLVINKCDAVTEAVADKKLQTWTEHIKPLIGYKISALKGDKLPDMLAKIVELLPFHPPYYDKDQLTDRPMRFFVSEIIREKIMLNYGEEIPYSVEVEIEEYQEEEKIDRIRALIVTNRESQKPILIGKAGAMLKKVGTEARVDLEKFLGKKVFLELFVKVRENWRNDERFLRYKGFDL
jgi:GTP-binding protein Era